MRLREVRIASTFQGQGLLTTVPNDQWIFMAASFDNTTAVCTLYIGDETTPVSTRNVAVFACRLIENDDPLRIGGNTPFYSRPAPGLLDDLRVYNSLLSMQDIEQVRLSNVPETAGRGRSDDALYRAWAA